MTCKLPEERHLPTLHPVISVPTGKNKVVIGTVCIEVTISYILHTQQNAVMKNSHLAGCHTTTHVVLFQIFMEQLERFLQPAGPVSSPPCL